MNPVITTEPDPIEDRFVELGYVTTKNNPRYFHRSIISDNGVKFVLRWEYHKQDSHKYGIKETFTAAMLINPIHKIHVEFYCNSMDEIKEIEEKSKDLYAKMGFQQSQTFGK
jgi:hypothetical protein